MSIIKSIKELDLVKVSLVAIASILIIINVWTYLNSQNQIASMAIEINSLNSSYNDLEVNHQSLNNSYYNYISSHTYNNSEYENLAIMYQSLNDTHQNYIATYNVSFNDFLNLNTTYNSLFLEHESYKSSHNYTNTEYEELKNEFELLKVPRLSELSIYSEDIRPQSQSPRLHIYGEVWNVGSNTAYNCKLHIVAYQGSVIAIDREILLGSVLGENRVSLDENVNYEGGALTNWFITVMWTLYP